MGVIFDPVLGQLRLSDPSGTGTVTSISGSGGTTGLTLTGGPITTTGTLTLGGTLAIANGGTGSTTQNFVDLTTAQTVGGAKTFSTSLTTPILNAPTGRTATFTVAASNATATVKAQADYVCDGTADDVEIQAALSAVTAAGSGSVYLSAGTFYIAAGMTLPSVPWTLYGAGTGATYLRFVNGVNANMFSYTSTTQVTFSLMGGMTLYGNAANQTGNPSVSTNTGVYINSSGNLWDARFQDLFILNFRSQGFYTNYAHDYVFDHVIVEFCGLTTFDYIPAVQWDGGDEAYMTNCLIKLNNGRGMSIGTYGTTINNNHFVQNGGVGLLIYAQNCSLVNNVFDDNGELATNTYPDIWLLNPHTVVSANTFLGSASKAQYNLLIDSGSTANIVTGNNFQNYATAAVSDGGSGTVYVGNTNWPSTLQSALNTQNVSPLTNATYTLGSSSLYWLSADITSLNLNSTASLSGSSAGTIALTGTLTANATSIITDTTTGLKIGTATSQKLGFFNATPIVQVGATIDLGVVLSNLGLRASGTAYPITTSAVISGGTVTSTGNITLPTTSSSVGNILVNGTTMVHFYGTGNAFIGTSSGNYTLTTASSRNNFGGGGNTLTALTTGANNAAIGAFSGAALTTGGNNSYVGGSAGQSNQTGNNNIGIGNNALTSGTGSNNTAIGQNAGQALVGGTTNTFVGGQSGFTNISGGGNVYLGYKSGYYETASNAFYVNNLDQSTLANDKAFSLLYGTFSGSAGSLSGQQLTINGTTNHNGNVLLTTAGNKLSIATGTNASAGTGTLTAGTVTISTTAVTASSLIFLTDTASSITNVGSLTVSAKSAGTSFTVTSTLALDSSTFNWLIVN